MRIGDYADSINKSIVIRRRTRFGGMQWYADFGDGGSEIHEGGVLKGVCGNGVTPNEALRDLARVVSNQTIIFHAYSNRQEFDVPDLMGGG